MFVSRACANTWSTRHPIQETLAEVGDRVLLDPVAGGHPIFIVSGGQRDSCHGPVALSSPSAGVLLYTTVPWLYDTSPHIVYQGSY